jgi:hypothetical protein
LWMVPWAGQVLEFHHPPSSSLAASSPAPDRFPHSLFPLIDYP